MSKYRKYIVGTNRDGYPERKNFFYAENSLVRYQKVIDAHKIIDRTIFSIKKRFNPFYHNTFREFPWDKSELFHFFNTVSLGKKPWVTTFEYELPRHIRNNSKAWNAMNSSNCLALIAMSKNAINVQEWFNNQNSIAYNDVSKKLTLLYPPQRLEMELKDKKFNTECLNFIFVGNAFYHKGGFEMLKAMDFLWENQHNFNLTIVSDFSKNNWLDSDIDQSDQELCMNLMKKHSIKISIYSSIPYEKVISLYKESDAALLPSLGETFGYSVLEAQACFCPVITTNSWAMLEINSTNLGWIMDLPVIKENGGVKGDLSSPIKRKKYRKCLTESLIFQLRHILENPNEIKTKALKAHHRILTKHDPMVHSQRLYEIYSTK